MSIIVTCLDTESGETSSVTLMPGQFVVCCAEPAHVVSDVAYANGKNQIWVKRNRIVIDKFYKRPRGICSVCGKERALTSFRDVAAHLGAVRLPGRSYNEQCAGSHKPPQSSDGA